MAAFSGGYFTLLGKDVLENDPSYQFIQKNKGLINWSHRPNVCSAFGEFSQQKIPSETQTALKMVLQISLLQFVLLRPLEQQDLV